ncbi:MAG: hypothetical protein A2W90_23725 [Bacteroidetes bacterium GWF2_42_66]|nr:MAG: hypothetical protein A2W92_16545 [Bacteroidetes bacterium GWA2_42_15]OFY00301.1 MAG: hypothetical protein A2W89_13940 [Bacteroidetes bacterium GWE2_42_39]OFY47128.1 MAG: hypothetical protein A2W90_23725 [Bacteroidetes bacterium GWF2_42_66]HBL76691.1 hypothetical protein [Prolixibacteraceae bacterium]HCR92026.1 hypothetical protein [Prolixibacteraceae bacterium]
MIKAVIFDFGQTLVDSASGFRTAEKQAEQRLFENISQVDWDDFIDCYRRIRRRFVGNSDFSRIAMWKELFSAFDQKGDEMQLKQWETEYWETVKNCTKPFPETESVLARLKTMFRLAVITNTQGQRGSGTHRISLFPEIEKYLDVLIVSGESGIPAKPDPVPFLLCLEKLGVINNEAVFVGDDWNIDMVGAKNAGIHPIWLKHHLVKRNWPDVEETVPVITSLDQLIDSNGMLNFYSE